MEGGGFEAGSGTKCSSRTGECSNSIDGTVFFSIPLSILGALMNLVEDGSCTEDEPVIVHRSLRRARWVRSRRRDFRTLARITGMT